MPLSTRTARFFLALVGVAAFIGLGHRAGAQSGDPAIAKIDRFYAVLLDTMKQAERLGVEGRYRKLEPAMRATFDLPAMTRIAIGPAWTTIPAETQTALTDAFSRMSIATYASRFDGYSGERFEVDPAVEKRGSDVVVHTRLVAPSREPVPLNYLMRASGGDWKIVDVYLSGTISELATRRAEFSTFMKSGGADAVLASLRSRTEHLLHGGG